MCEERDLDFHVESQALFDDFPEPRSLSGLGQRWCRIRFMSRLGYETNVHSDQDSQVEDGSGQDRHRKIVVWWTLT